MKPCHPKGVARRTAQAQGVQLAYALRFLLTLPYTLAGLAWGLAWGGRPRWRRGCIVECAPMRGGYARGGITVGSVWLHGGLSGDDRLAHESVHATQWALFGPFLPPLYWIAELLWPLQRNPFERWAGLARGGYEEP